MPSFAKTLLAGAAGGLVASLAMNLFQSAAASVLGQDDSDAEPATVQAADSAKRLVADRPVADEHRAAAGSIVHYATGAALGVGYALAARRWRQTTAGFGLAYGVAIATVLDDAAVPAFGWGPPPSETPPATHAYGLASHAIFGLTLEGTRRAVVTALA